MIIGIGHTKGQGKDTFAAFLRDYLLSGTHIVSLAGPLYSICHMLYGHIGFKTKEWYDANRHISPDLKEVSLSNGFTPRQLLLALGEKGREIDPVMWIQYAMSLDRPGTIMLVPDVRHPNEVEAIKQQGGLLIKIVRPIVHVIYESNDIDQNLENYDGWDHIVMNNGSLAELKLQAIEVAKKYDLGNI